MHPHRYRIGQTVRFVESARIIAINATPSGKFRVAGLLPDYRGDKLYRIESTSDGQQHVVAESEILETSG